MTQMLLFDSASASPSAIATANSATLSPAHLGNSDIAVPVVAPAAASPAAAGGSQRSRKTESATNNSGQSGLNHMGDLARLVLLRYDLVAARRAKNHSGRSSSTPARTAK